MRRIAIVALALVLAGCGGDSTAPSGPVSGTYTLRTVNGSSLPYNNFSAGYTITSAVLTMSNDGSYSLAIQFGDGSVEPEQGFWSNINGSITFDPTGGSEYQASLSGNVLTEIFAGETDIYQRQ